MFAAIKDYFFGDDQDTEELPEAVEIDPVNPKFEHFSKRLNVAAWDDEHQLFHLDCENEKKQIPLGVGFVVELNPMRGASDEDVSLLMSLYELLPDHAGVQVITFASPNIDKFFTKYEQIQSSRGDTKLGVLFKVLSKKRTNFWRKATTQTMFTGYPIRLRHFRVILSVNLNSIDAKSKIELASAANVRQQVISSLSNSNMFRNTWKPIDLIEWNRDFLNPARLLHDADREFEDVYEDDKPIRDQVINPDTFMRILNNGEEVRFGFKKDKDAVAMRAYSVKSYPGNRPFHLNMMRGLIGDERKPSLNYPCPFYLIMNMVKGDYEKTKSSVTVKSAEAIRRSTQPLARFLPEMVEKAQDWALLQASYNNNTGGSVEMFNQVILLDLPENIVASENTAYSIWRANGFDLTIDKYLQAQSILAALPMSLDKDLKDGLSGARRWTTKTMLNSVTLSPLMGEWTGVGNPTVGLFGRNGEAMGLDIFANPSGNFNVACIGTSGSGKSFLLNEIARNLLGSGAHGYIIDKGRSYEPLCRFLDGQYIEFKEDSKLVINPFDMVIDISEDILMMKLIFSTMAAPKTGLNELQESAVEKVIQRLWIEKGATATIDDVAEELIEYRNEHGDYLHEVNRLGSQMFSFTTKGIYGRWFSGKTNLNFNNELVVLEMDDLQNKPDLQKVIVKLVLYIITQKMYDTRDRRKFVMIDEAWDLLEGGSDGAKLINEGYRKARKYSGSFITATQNAADYSLSLAAEAALQNADWIFALRGKEQSIEILSEKLKLSDFQKAEIRSLKTIQGVFSEVWVYYSEGSGIGRLYSDPYNQLMASTRAEDFQALQMKTEMGMNISEALDAVLFERQNYDRVTH